MKRFIIAVTILILLAMTGVAGAVDGCKSSGLLTGSGAVIAAGGDHAFCSILIITNGSNAATAILYDNASTGSGTEVFKGTVAGASNFGGGDAGTPITLGNGLYLTLSGTGANVIIYYK